MDNIFEKDLEIDKFSLDAECLDQSRRFMVWSEQLVDAIAERDRADQKLEVIKAEVDRDIRENPEKYGLDKVTEAAIKSSVTLDQRVQTSVEEWINARHKVGILTSAKEALEQRKTMIENLVKLFLQGYWSEPKVKTEDKDALTQEKGEAQKNALNESPRLKAKKK